MQYWQSFLQGTKKKEIKWKKNKTATRQRQRQDSVTVGEAIVSKIDKQKNKIGTGHRQGRDESFEARQ